jgi:hypothetical protein
VLLCAACAYRSLSTSICITGLSYTATNLLYDFDDNPPITDNPSRPNSCLPTKQPTPNPHQQQQQQHQKQVTGSGVDVAALADTYPSVGCDVTQSVDDSAHLPVVMSAPAVLRGAHNAAGGMSGDSGGLVAGGSDTVRTTTVGDPAPCQSIEGTGEGWMAQAYWMGYNVLRV